MNTYSLDINGFHCDVTPKEVSSIIFKMFIDDFKYMSVDGLKEVVRGVHEFIIENKLTYCRFKTTYEYIMKNCNTKDKMLEAIWNVILRGEGLAIADKSRMIRQENIEHTVQKSKNYLRKRRR